MNSLLEIHRNRQRLDALFRHYKDIENIGNDELNSHYAGYLCVRVSGYLETSIKLLLFAYCENKANDLVAAFVDSHLQGLTNVKEEKLRKILGAFSRDWAEKFSQMIDEEHKNAFDSIVVNRNAIAHGKNNSMTYVRVKRYYDLINQALAILKTEILKL